MNAQKFDFKKYTQKLITLLSLGLMLLLLSTSEPASAQTVRPKWTTSAATCFANGRGSFNNLVYSPRWNARFEISKKGWIYLMCPFTDARLHGAAVSTIELTMQGRGNYKALAVLRQIHRATGDPDDVLRVSNADDCLGDSINPYFNCKKTYAPSTLNFLRYYYVVEIRLYRATTEDDVTVLGARIY